MPQVRLTCGRAHTGFYPPRAGLPGEGADLPILSARRPPRSSRLQPAAGCWSAGPPGPLQLSPCAAPRPSPASARGSGAWSGVPHPQPSPTLGRARREGGDCGEGGKEGRRPPPGAWSARGPRAASAARDSQCSAPRPDSVGSARRAGIRGCWRASPVSARAPAGEGPGCASSQDAAPETTAGARGRGPATPRTPAGEPQLSRGGHPEFSSPCRLLLPTAAGRLWILRGSPAPLPAGSRA